MTLTRLLQSAVALAGIVAGAAGATGCSSNPTSPSENVPYSQADLRVGTGTEVATGNNVVVKYSGWFYDPNTADHRGVLFDTSGDSTLTVTVGAGQVIAGWDQGLVGMKEGGIRRLIVPPSLGYGGVRFGPIPPYTTLVFDIEVISVVQPGS